MTLPADPVWFITGASTGFGRTLSEEVIARGWRLVATARDVDDVRDLAEGRDDKVKAVALDVTKPDTIAAAVKAATGAFGRLDVVVNNAGYGYMAAIEEGEDEPVRAMFETNVFGLIAVTKAVLPTLREQKAGWMVNMSSVAGQVAFVGSGYYSATKHAVEAVSEALSKELEPIGPKVLVVEPGPFRTDFAGRSLKTTDHPLDAYAETAGARREEMRGYAGSQPGDPVRAAKAIVDVLSSDDPPLRLVLGKMGEKVVREKLQGALDDMAEWKETTLATDFPEGEG
ncbi:MAG: SDR family NAD(P)-dependent oxidoreductase [Caulobacteraceae bacterium]|nr:SDR family NAD(P)-dependent oxidoreductase [Caulobacter sp.]